MISRHISFNEIETTLVWNGGFERTTWFHGYDFRDISIKHGNGKNLGYNPYELKAFDSKDIEIWTIYFDIINPDREK